MTYVMSDIHGHYKQFIEMLEKIKFNDNDKLYIIGDVIDRGPDGAKMLLYCQSHQNVTLLRGNHELMYQDSFISGDKNLWYNNGGRSTMKGLMKETHETRLKLFHYIKALPDFEFIEIEATGKAYLLCHAGLSILHRITDDIVTSVFAESVRTCDVYWSRDVGLTKLVLNRYFQGLTLIHGHTPVDKIKHEAPNIVNIDCGCARLNKLGCLCLDTMEEFYVEIPKNLLSLIDS